MLELEHTLDDFGLRRIRTLNAHRPLGLANHNFLLGKFTQTLENQITRRRRDFHLLTKTVHIAANLLEIIRRHIRNRREIQAGNLNILHTGIEELQEIVLRRLLLSVLHHNTKFVRILGRQVNRQIIIVLKRLDELEQVVHIDTKYVLRGAVKVLKAVGIETKIDKVGVRLIDGNNLDTRRVELQVRICKDILQCFNKGPKCRTLDRLNLKQVPICIGLGTTGIAH